MKALSKEMKQLLEAQIGVEYFNCAAYWALEWALRAQSFKGMAKFMHESAQDERHHGKKIAYWLIDRGEEPPLDAEYKQVPPYGKSPLEIFQMALDLERATSAKIEAMVTQAENDDDPETRDFLSWYVDEQVDSENCLVKKVKKLQKAGNDYAALLELD